MPDIRSPRFTAARAAPRSARSSAGTLDSSGCRARVALSDRSADPWGEGHAPPVVFPVDHGCRTGSMLSAAVRGRRPQPLTGAVSCPAGQGESTTGLGLACQEPLSCPFSIRSGTSSSPSGASHTPRRQRKHRRYSMLARIHNGRPLERLDETAIPWLLLPSAVVFGG